MKTMKPIIGFFALLLFSVSISFAQDEISLSKGDKNKVNKDSKGMEVEAKGLRLILVCDQSGSMSENNKMNELNDALKVLFQGMGQDAILSKSVDLAIVSFESGVNIARQPQKISSGEAAPQFQPTGSTNMSAALQEAQNLAQNAPSEQLKPIVILLTDGIPDDQNGAASAANGVKNVAHFFALGVSGADFSYLQTIAGTGQAMTLQGTKFKQFFNDMQMSVKKHIMSAKTMGVNPSNFTVENTQRW